MQNAKSLLDSLIGGLNAQGGVSGVAQKAKGAWDGQSGLAKGAIAGGLLGILMGGSGTRKMAGSALKVGGAALIGGIAYKAYQDWQAGKTAQPDAAPAALPSPEGTVFLPSDPVAADNLSARLLRAMVAAAKADGHVTPTERRRIGDQLATLGLGAEAQAMIEAELDSPLDVGKIAEMANGPEEAAEIYAASLLVVDPDAPAEKGYLAMLAARMNLPPGLVDHLHSRAASLA
jgi:uncharacterized membrane protein YebE (DUF533 family)